MSADRERFGGGWVPPWVEREHAARYAHAARFLEGRAVLDCACGTGVGTREFLLAGARSLVAVDLAREAVEATRGRAPGAAVVRGSAAAVPLRAQSVDVVVSLETIEHLPDDEAYVGEMARVLRPEGLFICSTPNREVTNPGSAIGARPFNPFHLREYSEREFGAILARRFGEVHLLGQTPCSPVRVRVMASLGARLGSLVAARLAQAMKLPRLLRDRAQRYEVTERDPRRRYEYLVAVCRRPRT